MTDELAKLVELLISRFVGYSYDHCRAVAREILAMAKVNYAEPVPPSGSADDRDREKLIAIPWQWTDDGRASKIAECIFAAGFRRVAPAAVTAREVHLQREAFKDGVQWNGEQRSITVGQMNIEAEDRYPRAPVVAPKTAQPPVMDDGSKWFYLPDDEDDTAPWKYVASDDDTTWCTRVSHIHDNRALSAAEHRRIADYMTTYLVAAAPPGTEETK